jgi:hypothetical protein
MFNTTKYSSWYYAIIDTARKRKTEEYTEKHHIIPKSLGGSNENANIVSLTAREHFICHNLLVRMLDDPHHRGKMIYAVWAMATMKNEHQESRHNIRSREYERLRKLRSFQQKQLMKGITRQPLSEETKQKISNTLKGKKLGPQTKEHIEKRFMNRKQTNSNKGKKIGKRARCCCIVCQKEVDVVNFYRYHSHD